MLCKFVHEAKALKNAKMAPSRVYPLLKLDNQSATPLFDQIALAFENAIRNGLIESGQMLPSSRELAESAQIARGTVVRAYDLLQEKGLVEGKKGKGLVVSRNEVGVLFTDLMGEVGSGIAQNPQNEARPQELVHAQPVEDVTKAAVPRSLLPVRRWKELIISNCDQLGKIPDQDVALGDIELRGAIAKFLATTRGVICSAEQISVYTNTDQALDTIARLLVRPGDTVVVEEPGYIGVSNLFAAAGARIFANGVDERGMTVTTLRNLEVAPKALYCTPISQDPLGIVMSDERQSALIEWARRQDCYIVEDSWDTDFWHARKPSPCLQQKAPDQVIHLYSFWKVLFPLSNACFLAVPERLVPQLKRLRFMINRPPISIELMALKDLLESGELNSLVAKIQKSYRKRRQALLYSLSKVFGDAIKISPVSGGTHILVTLRFQAARGLVLSAARESGLKVISLDDYYFDGRTTNSYVVYFTAVAPGDVYEQVVLFRRLLGM